MTTTIKTRKEVREMEEDFRYKMQHFGDIFVSNIKNFGDALTSNIKNLGPYVKGFPRGIVLTYSIDELKSEKDKILKWIGRRLAAMRNKGIEQDVRSDEEMIKLFQRLDVIQEKIDAGINEREERQRPKG
jgi:hypothetical protein